MPKIVPTVTVDQIDPDKTYEVSVSATILHGGLKLRPAHNPYVLKGSVVVSIFDAIKPGSVREL